MSIATLQLAPSQVQKWLGARSSPPLKVAAILTIIVIIAGAAAVAWQCLEVFSASRQERERTSEVQQRLERLQTQWSKPVQLHSKEQLAEYNRVTRTLNTPWATIFALLERRIPRDIALISIEPDAARRLVRLQAEARTLDDLMECAESLRKDSAVARVLPLQHETNEQDPSRPVRLTFELTMQDAQ